MIGYRYLEPNFARVLVDRGSVRLATTGSVAALATGLQDRTDGAVEMLLNERVEVRPQTPAYWALLEQGIQIEGEVPIHFVDTRCRQSIPGWILCMADTPDNAHLARVAAAQSAVVEIRELQTVAELIASALPPNSQSAAPRVGPVRYDRRRFEGLAMMPVADPFTKHTDYASECEIRVFWQSVAAAPAPIIVEVPELRDYVRLVRG